MIGLIPLLAIGSRPFSEAVEVGHGKRLGFMRLLGSRVFCDVEVEPDLYVMGCPKPFATPATRRHCSESRSRTRNVSETRRPLRSGRRGRGSQSSHWVAELRRVCP